MMEHMDWHNKVENLPANREDPVISGNYGERFLLFHKQYIEKFDVFRITKSRLMVSSWDPSTVIPPQLPHEVPLMPSGLRDTDNPSSVDPWCKTPTWITFSGGTIPDPRYGHKALWQWQFLSLDELGRAIDSSWHGKVHNTIGGDMKQFHSPIDPIFWPWHKWIDEIRSLWNAGLIALSTFAGSHRVELLRPIFDKITTRLAPPSMVAPVPLLFHFSKPTIDVSLALAVNEISNQLSDSESRESLRKTAVNLLNNVIQQITEQSDRRWRLVKAKSDTNCINVCRHRKPWEHAPIPLVFTRLRIAYYPIVRVLQIVMRLLVRIVILVDLYIVDLHATLEKDIPKDLDSIDDREHDILFHNRTRYDEKVANIVSDYVNLTKKLIALSKNKGASNYELDNILISNQEEIKSRKRSGKRRNYSDLLKGRSKIWHIERKDDPNSLRLEKFNSIFLSDRVYIFQVRWSRR
ncbi:MAG: tyrosinase family protein [Thermoproteota archaeon]|nr:tyrosinase family protein [Thermoproteota archaeon]